MKEAPTSINASTWNRLLYWINQRSGIHITSNNDGGVAVAVQILANEAGIDMEYYCHQLLQGQQDAQLFIDRIVTGESFFLRYGSVTKLIIEHVIRPLLAKNIKPRVLSIPCARGEEPYSFAILLQEAGINPNRVDITGIDISQENINKARSGSFHNYSFRRVPPMLIKQYFTPQIDGHKLIESIKHAVQFHRTNILSLNEKLSPGFHVILFNNLLIYFDQKTTTHVLNILKNLLSPDGWLFVDSAEAPRLRPLFQPVALGEHYGYRKKSATPLQTPLIKKQIKAPHRPINNGVKNRPPESTQSTKDYLTRPLFTPPAIAPKKQPVKPSITPRKTTTFEQLMKAAKTAYDKKLFDEAIEQYEEIAVRHPSHIAIVHAHLSQIFADLGEGLRAMELAESALLENTNQTEKLLSGSLRANMHAIIGIVLRNKGLHHIAQNHFEQIRQLDEQHPALRITVGSKS